MISSSTSLKLLGDLLYVLSNIPPYLKRKIAIISYKKPGKATFEMVSAWRPIVLLKTIGKVTRNSNLLIAAHQGIDKHPNGYTQEHFQVCL